ALIQPDGLTKARRLNVRHEGIKLLAFEEGENIGQWMKREISHQISPSFVSRVFPWRRLPTTPPVPHPLVGDRSHRSARRRPSASAVCLGSSDSAIPLQGSPGPPHVRAGG